MLHNIEHIIFTENHLTKTLKIIFNEILSECIFTYYVSLTCNMEISKFVSSKFHVTTFSNYQRGSEEIMACVIC